jgi:hypothetical protein|tara:strand:+ start:57 stop:293 length:237 start_codon:yes stop_codon:yes gene_type:complete
MEGSGVMIVPDFNSSADVRNFLNGPSDALFTPMIEEYMILLHHGFIEHDFDIEELNGWIDHEMQSLTEGYEEWYNGNG